MLQGPKGEELKLKYGSFDRQVNECGYHYVIMQLRSYLLSSAQHILETYWRHLACQLGTFVGYRLADRRTLMGESLGHLACTHIIGVPIFHEEICMEKQAILNTTLM